MQESFYVSVDELKKLIENVEKENHTIICFSLQNRADNTQYLTACSVPSKKEQGLFIDHDELNCLTGLHF